MASLDQLFVGIVTIIGIVMVVGVGLVVLVAFRDSTGVVGTEAATALNNSITAIGVLPNTYLTLIITILSLAVVMGLVFSAFVFMKLRN